MKIPTCGRLILGCGVAAVLLLLQGCAVGPKYKQPSPPDVSGYTPAPVSTTTGTPGVPGGEAQQLEPGRDILGDWWTLFHSQPLNELVERSLKANPNLKAAQAALLVARENVLAQRGFYYPSVSAGFAASRAKTSQELSPNTASGALNYSLFTPSVSVSFVPDVFGLNRRTVESLRAQEQGARFALAATHITLSSNVVAAAIQEASLRAQIEATRQLIAINTDMLNILRDQFANGYVSRLDVAAQETQLAQVAASLAPLEKQLAQQRDLLAVLAGGYPSQGPPEMFELSSLELPRELPLSLPSQLVEQRPDVRQAEENLHTASALIGVARANRLPTFSITGDIGTMALAFGRMFTEGNGFRDATASVTDPIFQGGTLKHRELAARAAYVQAEEQYRATVLASFQNVADSLHALQQDAEGLKATAAAKDAAASTLEMSRKRYQSGYVNYLSLLSAEQGYQQALLSFAQAQAIRYADTAALFQALGGGWWNRADLPKK